MILVQALASGRGYILTHTMTQALMGQRSDALISLIDGLEAQRSRQKEGLFKTTAEQVRGGERSE